MNAKGIESNYYRSDRNGRRGRPGYLFKNNQVDEILIINRKSVGFQHPKLKEIIHSDFLIFILLKMNCRVMMPVSFALGFHR